MSQIPSKITALINEQIHLELSSHTAYLAMAAFFERGAFKGFAHWMRAQATEEHAHAMKFFDYLVSRNANVILESIGAPKTEFKLPLEVFKFALKREELVSKSINAIYEAASDCKDYATLEMLNWFLKEQVEEEDTTNEMIDRIALAGADSAALLQLDHEAGERK